MSNLGVLHLKLNRLFGTVPTEIVQLTNLRVFSIYGNKFSEPQPPGFSAFLGTINGTAGCGGDGCCEINNANCFTSCPAENCCNLGTTFSTDCPLPPTPQPPTPFPTPQLQTPPTLVFTPNPTPSRPPTVTLPNVTTTQSGNFPIETTSSSTATPTTTETLLTTSQIGPGPQTTSTSASSASSSTDDAIMTIVENNNNNNNIWLYTAIGAVVVCLLLLALLCVVLKKLKSAKAKNSAATESTDGATPMSMIDSDNFTSARYSNNEHQNERASNSKSNEYDSVGLANKNLANGYGFGNIEV